MLIVDHFELPFSQGPVSILIEPCSASSEFDEKIGTKMVENHTTNKNEYKISMF